MRIQSGVIICLATGLLMSCGGGGGGEGNGGVKGGRQATSAPPFIAAELISFPAGSIPAGFKTSASVEVLDDSSGASIATASVVMNGVNLIYDVTNEDYEGNVVVAPGGAVALSVTTGGIAYTASAKQFTSYPTISTPASPATWNSSVANTVTWSGGAPMTNADYSIGILDAADPTGALIWPLDHFLQDVPTSATSYAIPPISVTAGNRLVIVGISTSGVTIPKAAPGSTLVVAGFNYVPVSVTGPPVTSRTSGTLHNLHGVTWSGTQFVAVGNAGTIVTSPDGMTWTSRISGTLNDLLGVTWSGTQFVAVGNSGAIVTSPDGITWTSRISGTMNDLDGIAWSGAQFVAVGWYGTILASPDGITWTSHFLNLNVYFLQAVAWSGTQFVAVGRDGVVLTSPDGVTWTAQVSGTASYMNSIIWSGTQFVAVGTDNSFYRGKILTSPDGVTWTSHTAGTSLTGIAWSGTQFVAVGATGDLGDIFTSPDAITWTPETTGTTHALSSVVWSGSEFVMVGVDGAILTSP